MANGDPKTVIAQPSIDKFGVQANALGWPHNDLHLTEDADVSRLITKVLHQQKDDFVGISSIEVDADQDPVHLFGVLCQMASTGIGNQATFDVHWAHPSGEALNDSLKMVGLSMSITMEGKQAKLTGQIRTVKNSP